MDQCFTCLGGSPRLLLLPIFSIRISYFTSCLVSFLRQERWGSASPLHICMFLRLSEPLPSPALEPELSWDNWWLSSTSPSPSPTISGLSLTIFLDLTPGSHPGKEDVGMVRRRILKQWLSWIGSGDTFRGTWSAVYCCSTQLYCCSTQLYFCPTQRIWAADDFSSPALSSSWHILGLIPCRWLGILTAEGWNLN